MTGNVDQYEPVLELLKPSVLSWIKQALSSFAPGIIEASNKVFCEHLKETVDSLLERAIVPMQSHATEMNSLCKKLADRIKILEKKLISSERDINNIMDKTKELQEQLKSLEWNGKVHRTHNTNAQYQMIPMKATAPSEVKTQTLEQRQNNLRIIGLADSSGRSLENLFTFLLGRKVCLSEDVTSYTKLGHPTETRPQTILIAFREKCLRNEIYMARWKLGTQSNIFINEDLSKEAYQTFKNIRRFAKSIGVRKVWSFNKQVIMKVGNGKFRIQSIQELKDLVK